MTKKDVIQLFKLVPEEKLADIGAACGVDANVSRLYGDRMFKLLVYAAIRGERMSTRFLEELYNMPFFRALSGKGGHRTRHSSIAARLGNMPAEYLEEIFSYLVSRHGKSLQGQGMYKRIKAFDSTLVAISSALVDWGMRVGRPPKDHPAIVQLKLTLQLHAGLPALLKSFFAQSHLSEEVALKEIILDSGLKAMDIVLFDRGLKGRKTLKLFDEMNIQFVTRGTAGVKFDVLEQHRQIKGRKADGLCFLHDAKVYLYSDRGQLFEHPFRLIEAEVIESGKRLVFITNIWDLNAMQIARLYRKRWDIEVFFRFIKQELGIKHLISHTENGVKNQIYAALIAAILIMLYKKANNITSYRIAKIRFEEYLLFQLVKELESIPHNTG